MNMKQSDAFIRKWQRKKNPLESKSFSLQTIFNTTPEILFYMLCPIREYDWIPGWKCNILHSRSGYSEYNTIFSTRSFGPMEIFVCTRFEPNSMIEYVRTTKDVCITLAVSIREKKDGTAISQWTVTACALHEEGNREVFRIIDTQDDIPQVFELLEQYLTVGIQEG